MQRRFGPLDVVVRSCPEAGGNASERVQDFPSTATPTPEVAQENGPRSAPTSPPGQATRADGGPHGVAEDGGPPGTPSERTTSSATAHFFDRFLPGLLARLPPRLGTMEICVAGSDNGINRELSGALRHSLNSLRHPTAGFDFVPFIVAVVEMRCARLREAWESIRA